MKTKVFEGPDGDWWYRCGGTFGPYDSRAAAEFMLTEHEQDA